jgi:hypothetical protein
LKATWDRITNFNLDQIPLLTASEQTRGSWAKEIETPEMVPDIYKEFYTTQFNGKDNFPYSVLTPKFNGFLHHENEKLICSQDGKIFVLENVNNQLIDYCFSIQDINYIEAGSILLKAWIRINGLTDNGASASSTLRFNTVTEYMFHPFVDKIRSANTDGSSIVNASALAKFDYLSDIDFKFMNYAKNAVKSGERVIDHVFQPEIRSKFITILGKSLYRTASTTHISILTEKVLLMITDTGSGNANGNRRFGGTWLFIPVEKIQTGSITEKGDGLLELSLTLPEDEHIDTLFSELKKPDVERLLKNINTLKTR